MCKAPVAGRVKTRLMPRYTPAQAAVLHAAMATTVIRRAVGLFGDVIIAADDPAHPFFAAFDLPQVSHQGEGDLGARMQRQVERAMADGAAGVMLLGTDSPHMPATRLLDAAAALQHFDLALGPVEDGGYDLIAMRSFWPLFDGIEWSSEQVLAQTLAKAEALGLAVEKLSTGFDVDTPPDVMRAIACGWEFRGNDL